MFDNIYSFIHTINYSFFGLMTFSLGIYALVKNAKEPVNRIFFLFCLSIGLVGVFDPLFRTSTNFVEAYIYDPLLTVPMYVIVGSFLLFTIFFNNRKGLKSLFAFLILYFPFFIVVYLEFFTNLADIGYARSFYGIRAVDGPLGLFRFVIDFVIYPIIGIILIFDKYRSSKETYEKRQCLLLMLGTFLPLFIGGAANEVLPILGITPLPLLMFSFFFWSIFILIAIIKYRFVHISPDNAVETIALVLPTSLLTTDLSGQINYCNQSSVKLFKRDLIGSSLPNLSKTESLKEVFKDILSKKIKSNTFETELQKSDNSTFPSEVIYSPIDEKDKTLGLLWDIRDLTTDFELKQNILNKQKELKEKIVEVEQMNEMMKGREARFEELVKELNELRVKFDLPPY